jgi:hypothetical protein
MTGNYIQRIVRYFGGKAVMTSAVALAVVATTS